MRAERAAAGGATLLFLSGVSGGCMHVVSVHTCACVRARNAGGIAVVFAFHMYTCTSHAQTHTCIHMLTCI